MEDEIVIGENTYRIKKMNAIEFLAIQTNISFKTVKDTIKCYKEMLERVEVKFNDTWLPVKEEGKEVYYPNGIENNDEEIFKIIKFFLDHVKKVFPKSNG